MWHERFSKEKLAIFVAALSLLFIIAFFVNSKAYEGRFAIGQHEGYRGGLIIGKGVMLSYFWESESRYMCIAMAMPTKYEAEGWPFVKKYSTDACRIDSQNDIALGINSTLIATSITAFISSISYLVLLIKKPKN